MRHVEAAPAKINLSLRVLGKRDDGFHEIETLMVTVDGVADSVGIDIQVGEGGVELRCNDPALPLGDENLVLRAVTAFQRATALSFRGAIELEKQIPSGAGLGGGSSDAAATLRGLDAISGAGLGDDRLCELAAGIGSDVPFFIKARPSVCRGRGELIAPFPGVIPRTAVVLAKPAFGVPSAWAYSKWAGSEALPGVDYGPQQAPWGEAVNHLEMPTFQKYLVLPALKAWLLERQETAVALMSGSGATVFATLRAGESGQRLLQALRDEFGASTWARVAAIGSAQTRPV